MRVAWGRGGAGPGVVLSLYCLVGRCKRRQSAAEVWLPFTCPCWAAQLPWKVAAACLSSAYPLLHCTGVTDAGLKPRPIKRVAVLGGEAGWPQWTCKCLCPSHNIASTAPIGDDPSSSDAAVRCCMLCLAPLCLALARTVHCASPPCHSQLAPAPVGVPAPSLPGGLMGSGIATACVLNGIDVLLKEINQKFLDVSGGLESEQGPPRQNPSYDCNPPHPAT